jgi:hypothetical protein
MDTWATGYNLEEHYEDNGIHIMTIDTLREPDVRDLLQN